MSPTRRGGGHWMLWTSVALFLVLALLAFYHKYHDRLQSYFSEQRDATLLEELAAAHILDEPEPLGTAWPQWRGVGRDGVAHGKNLLLDWEEDGPPRLWKIKTGESYSSFAVFAGRAFTLLREGDKEVVVCLDLENKGERLWTFSYPCTYSNAYGNGPRSTPTLDREAHHALSAATGPYARGASLLPGDRLYTVGADGKFHCLDAVTGKPFWNEAHDLLTEFNASNLQWGIAFSPLIEGDLVITNPGGPNAAVVAFDKYTGSKRWATPVTEPAGYSSPIAVTAAGRRQVLVFAGKALLSVSPDDGSLNWRFPWEVNADVNAATPTVFYAEKDGKVLSYVFISSGYDKGCALLKLGLDDAGKPNARAVYVGNQMRNHFASSVRNGDYLYGFDETKLKCIDLKTGKKEWEEGGFQKGSLLLVEGKLIVLSENGKLALFEATPGAPMAKVEDSRAQALVRLFRKGRVRCWTMPVLADGRLLLRDEEEIICLDLRKTD